MQVSVCRSKLRNFVAVLLAISTSLSWSAVMAESIVGRLLVTWGDTEFGDYTVNISIVPSSGGERKSLFISEELVESVGGYSSLTGALAEIETSSANERSLSQHDYSVTSIKLSADVLPLRQSGVATSRKYISVMCKFADVGSEPQNLAFFQQMYGNSPGQLDFYWREASSDSLNLSGSTAVGWYTLPFQKSYYTNLVVGDPDDFRSDSSAMLDKLHEHCVNAADPDVNFADADGVNLMFNDRIGCCAWGGGAYYQVDGLSKIIPTTWEPPWGWGSGSVMVHEMGHSLGLPHSNNSDNDGYPYDNPWTSMSDAHSYVVRDSVYGPRGKHLNAYEKKSLGWLRPQEIYNHDGVTQTILNIDPLSYRDAGSNAYRAAIIPVNSASIDYYTVEVRANGFDGGEHDAMLPGNVVIIHSVKESRREPSWIVDANSPPAEEADTEGVMWRPGEVFEDVGNNVRVAVLSKSGSRYTIAVGQPDSQAPEVVIVTPTSTPIENGTNVVFSGNATDTGGSGFSSVRLRIRNNLTGDFVVLNNNSDSISVSLSKPDNKNNTNWNYIHSFLNPGSYRVLVRAFDRAGNSDAWETRDFVVEAPDRLAPQAVIVTPASSVITGPVIISGNATDNGGSGFSAVRFRVYNTDSDKFLILKNGTSTGSAALSKPNNLNNTNWSATQNLPVGNYRLFVKAVDKAGNQQAWVKKTFVVAPPPDTEAPIAVIVTPVNTVTANSVVTISGNATESGGSGFSAIRVRIFNRDTGAWLVLKNGNTIASASLSKPGNKHNTNWSFTNRVPRGNYRLFVKATDKAGNEQPWVKANFAAR